MRAKRKATIIISAILAALCVLFLFFWPYIIPVSRYQIPDEYPVPGNYIVLNEGTSFQNVYVSQDTKSKAIYVDTGNTFMQYADLDVSPMFTIPCDSLITDKNVRLIWFRNDYGQGEPQNPYRSAHLFSVRIIIKVHGKVLFDHVESFMERAHTVPGWLCLHADIMCHTG